MAATLRAPPPACPSSSPPPSLAFPHLGPGSIHPDGGFIFVFVCLLIHASSYSGHRRGFRSTTECKSPRRLIHFHPSLVDIQLLRVSPSLLQSGHVCFFGPYRIRRAVTRPASLPLFARIPCMSNTMRLLPPTNPLHLKQKKKKKDSLTPPGAS